MSSESGSQTGPGLGNAQWVRVIDRPINEVPVPEYTTEEHGTWELLLRTQESLIEGRACQPFIDGLRAVKFSEHRIPRLRDVSAVIESQTGWKLLRVEGLVHPRDFFELLSRKLFPSTDFIRKRSELEYTPEPDMFHDLFGHVPLLTNPDFTAFFENFGRVAVRASAKYPESHEIHQMLPRLYWFMVEFGLVNTPAGVRAYGSGSVSSPSELKFCVGADCNRHPFDIDAIAQRHYDIYHLQKDVFVIDSFAQMDREFRAWAKRMGVGS